MTTPMHRFTVRDDLRDSPTMSAAAMADAAKARGKKVEIVTIGDLFPKPPQSEVEGWLAQLLADAKKPENADKELYRTIREAAKIYAYSETTGLPSLRATVAHTFTRDTGLAATTVDVCIGTGGKGALNGALAVFKPGDVVLLAAPGWPTNYDMFPAGVILVELATGDGILRAPVLKEALAQFPEPAAILINAPCNPTGANYTADEREAFFALVNTATKATIVLSDDPYGKLVFDREPYDIAAVLKRGAAEAALFNAGRLACFRTVSKEYGLAGLRVGGIISKNKTMVASLKKWNESKGGGMGVEDQLKAQAALLYGDDFITRTVALLMEKRAILLEGIAALHYASVAAPRGTIYGWVDFSGLKGCTVPAEISESGAAYAIATPADAMRYLVNVAGVCGVPGTPFYAPDSPAAAGDWHVRISFCCEMAQLKTALNNLAHAEKMLQASGAHAA
ncbi:MAG: pyridoxal phosphate-dependent aminotransferase [Alphaproteobacteria bacterium]|nr:pyridoxal phosphate-dependent aminotransferase [Alphaproteobacteria bacterium]